MFMESQLNNTATNRFKRIVDRNAFRFLIVPRRKSKGTIVMGSAVRQSEEVLVSAIPHKQFSRDFDETFQLLFP